MSSITAQPAPTPSSDALVSRGRAIIFVGPAGAGKTTLAHRLIDKNPDVRGFSVSHTTRAIRPTETDGVDYHFLDRPDFEALIAQDAFLEWALVHDNYYGTARSEVERHLAAGRDVFFDIDIQGALNLYNNLADRALLVFITPPSWQVLVARLEGRGSETEQTLRRRLRTARDEFRAVRDSDLPWHVVINDALPQAERDLELLLAASRLGPQPAAGSAPAVGAMRGLLDRLCRAADADPRAAQP